MKKVINSMEQILSEEANNCYLVKKFVEECPLLGCGAV
jgi:hypothetical protein